MGIDISWKIIQGNTLDVWENALFNNEELVEDYSGELVWFLEDALNVIAVPPYYDASGTDCVYGVVLAEAEYAAPLNLEDIADKAQSVRKEFKDKYGIETETLCSQHVY